MSDAPLGLLPRVIQGVDDGIHADSYFAALFYVLSGPKLRRMYV